MINVKNINLKDAVDNWIQLAQTNTSDWIICELADKMLSCVKKFEVNAV